jgi:hypothetical protein
MPHSYARWGTAAALLFSMEVNAMSDITAGFDGDQVGAAPEGWTATLTGKGDPKWTVESDETAPSKLKILKQSGQATYPLLLKNHTSIKDGFIEVSSRPLPGRRTAQPVLFGAQEMQTIIM